MPIFVQNVFVRLQAFSSHNCGKSERKMNKISNSQLRIAKGNLISKYYSGIYFCHFKQSVTDNTKYFE